MQEPANQTRHAASLQPYCAGFNLHFCTVFYVYGKMRCHFVVMEPTKSSRTTPSSPDRPDGSFSKSFGLISHNRFGDEPIRKWREELEGGWANHLFVTFGADQSDFFTANWATARDFPLARGATLDTPGEHLCTKLFFVFRCIIHANRFSGSQARSHILLFLFIFFWGFFRAASGSFLSQLQRSWLLTESNTIPTLTEHAFYWRLTRWMSQFTAS